MGLCAGAADPGQPAAIPRCRGLASSEYRWEIGEHPGGFLPVRITYLFGFPQTVPGDSAD